MTLDALREWLVALEAQLADGEVPDRWTLLAYVAGRDLGVDPGELNEATRRAVLLLAAEGDPNRGLELDGRAVTALAADLERPGRREALLLGVDELVGLAEGLPRVREALFDLAAAPASAWRAYACGLLAEELGAED